MTTPCNFVDNAAVSGYVGVFNNSYGDCRHDSGIFIARNPVSLRGSSSVRLSRGMRQPSIGGCEQHWGSFYVQRRASRINPMEALMSNATLAPKCAQMSDIQSNLFEIAEEFSAAKLKLNVLHLAMDGAAQTYNIPDEISAALNAAAWNILCQLEANIKALYHIGGEA